MPTKTVTAGELVILLKNLTPRVVSSVAKAEQRNIEDAHAALIEASSGPFSQAQLDAADNPYSRRAPQSTSYPPQVINAQTGDFRRAWERHAPTVAADDDGVTITSSVTNADPVAKYMSGTRLMVPRPIVQSVQQQIKRQRKTRVKKAIADALTSNESVAR